MEVDSGRRHWSRLTLTLPPDASEALGELARQNLRDRRREALRLVLEGIEREVRERSTERER